MLYHYMHLTHPGDREPLNQGWNHLPIPYRRSAGGRILLGRHHRAQACQSQLSALNSSSVLLLSRPTNFKPLAKSPRLGTLRCNPCLSRRLTCFPTLMVIRTRDNSHIALCIYILASSWGISEHSKPAILQPNYIASMFGASSIHPDVNPLAGRLTHPCLRHTTYGPPERSHSKWLVHR